MFAILVEMWSMTEDDEFDLEYCGEFLWSEGFATGRAFIFPTAAEALEYATTYRKDDSINGFEYRYRVQPLDNFDGVFDDEDNWE